MMLITNRKTSKTAHFQQLKQQQRQAQQHEAAEDREEELSRDQSSSYGDRKRRVSGRPYYPHFNQQHEQVLQQRMQQQQMQPNDVCSSSVDSEIFLRNPVTGGFDATPDFCHSISSRRCDHVDVGYASSEDGQDTLHDSDIYTTFTKQTKINNNNNNRKGKPTKSGSWKCLSSNNRSNHTNTRSTTRGRSQNTSSNDYNKKIPFAGLFQNKSNILPSPRKKKGLFEQLKSTLKSSSRNFGVNKAQSKSTPLDTQLHDDNPVNHRRNEIPDVGHSTASRSAWSPPQTTLPVPPRQPKVPSPHDLPVSASVATPRVRPPLVTYNPNKNLLDNVQEDDEATLEMPPPSQYSSSSCLGDMMSFTTFGQSTRSGNNNSLSWSFDAISPIKCTTRDTTLHDDDDDSLKLPAILKNPQGDFDDDDDDAQTGGGLDMASVALFHDAASIQSRGALRLTEDGLKKHQKKAQNESFHLRTVTENHDDCSGDKTVSSKLETIVLEQKVQRLQEKQDKLEAVKRLEEEEAVRKYRHHHKYKDDVTSSSEDDARSDTCRAPINPRRIFQEQESLHRTSPPGTPLREEKQKVQSPKSTSPQVSSAKTPTSDKKMKPFGTIMKKLFHKRPDPEEMKQQWRERERQRVYQTQLEKQEAERKERNRIERRKRAYLEKQRQLEANVFLTSQETHDAKDHCDSEGKQQTIPDTTGVVAPAVEDPKLLSTSFRSLEQYHSNSMPRTIIVHPEDKFSCNSTVPTLSTSHGGNSMAPCSVCKVGARTHICMPCMHYAFCEKCIQGRNVCPICSQKRVTFSKVITGDDC